MGANNVPLSQRFWSKVAIGEKNQCWLWKAGRVKKKGVPFERQYGQFRFDGGPTAAHRMAFILKHNRFDLTPDYCVCHSCDNPPCCNPKHLWLGSQKANIQDATRKGRMRTASPEKRARGERHGHAKLTWYKVKMIRHLCAKGVPQSQVARRFKVTQPTIHAVVQNKTWKYHPQKLGKILENPRG